MESKGRILIFTGDGKGKTTAALGMALRAHGHGMPVAVIQFVKSDVKTGEFAVLSRLPGVEIFVTGLGFVPPEADPLFPDHRRAAEEGLRIASEAACSGRYGLVILDEGCYAAARNLVYRSSGHPRPEGSGPRRHHRPDRKGGDKGAHRRRRYGFRDPLREARIRYRPQSPKGGGVLMARCPTLVIAGTHSGSGKSPLALALNWALTLRGLAVQTFKVGRNLPRPHLPCPRLGPALLQSAGWPAGSLSAPFSNGPRRMPNCAGRGCHGAL